MIRSKYLHVVGYLDPMSKVSLLPWTYFNLQHCLEMSFARVTSHYGLLFSFYYIGRVLGRSFKHHTDLPPLSPVLTLLAVAYLILGITSRFSVICFCYALIGFSGGLIRSVCFRSEEDDEGAHLVNTRMKKGEPNYYSSTINSIIFVPIFVAFTYSTAITARNPPLLMCTICGCVCLFFAFRFLSLETSCFSSCCSFIVDFAKRETDTASGGPASKEDVTGTGNLSSLVGITEDSVTPPENFLQICDNDVAEAKKKYFATLQWRAMERMDEIVDLPQNPDTFANIIKYYPHGFQGRTREGAAVVYEQLGGADASGLTKHNITPQNLLRHFMLRNEFIYTKCFKNQRDGELNEEENRMPSDEDEPVTQLMSILDVNGVGFYSISTDVMTFIKISADVMDSHFPNAVVRLAVVNSPSWFYTVWSGIARILPQSVKDKVMFINDMKDLDQFIDPSMRPREYGGTGCNIRESADNKKFLALPSHWEEIRAKCSENTALVDDDRSGSELSQPVAPGLVRPDSSSMREWLQGKFARQNSEDFSKSKSNMKTEAYMGESNSYIYDMETGSWVLKLPDGVKKSKEIFVGVDKVLTTDDHNSTMDQLEEHGLLLAIQAAHDPSALKSHHARFSHKQLQQVSRSNSPRLSNKANSFNDASFNDSDDCDSSDAFPIEMPPAELVLLVVFIHFLNCFINGVFLTLVPLWLVSVTEKGGLDYGVRDCAVTLSSTGVILLLIQSYVGPKAQMALKIFPVRALRIAAGTITVFAFIISKLPQFNGVSPWSSKPIHTSSSALASANSETWLLWTMNSIIGHTYTVEADEHASGGEGLFLYYRPTPASNIMSVIVPAFFFGFIVSSIYLSRRASSTLLKISLTSVITSPSTVEHCVSALASILAPFVSCSIFLWAHRFNKEAPMDDSFFLSLIGSASFFIYLASMFLSLRFRGEFGIMPDDAVVHNDIVETAETNSSRSSPPSCSLYDEHGNLIISNFDCVSIPVQDIRYLLALFPGLRKKRKGNPLASRLFNLKLDIKDA